MITDTSEKGLEALITNYLCNNETGNGFILRTYPLYNRVDCIDEDLFFNFLQATQEIDIKKLQAIHGNNYKSKIVYRLNNQIKLIGIIEVLRKGITDNNIKLKLFFDKPKTSASVCLRV